MGAGIVQVSAVAGLDVVMIDVADEFIAKGMAGIEKGLGRDGREGPHGGRRGRDAALARITTSTDMAAGADADLFVEAAPESVEIKKGLFERAAATLREDAILASNTSSLPIGDLAKFVDRPRPLRRHPLLQPRAAHGAGRGRRGASRPATRPSPPPGLRRGRRQDADHRHRLARLRRQPHPLPDDQRGRQRAPREASRRAEDIDTGMKLGANWPDGPAGPRRPRRPGHHARRSSRRWSASSATPSTSPCPAADGATWTRASSGRKTGSGLLRLREVTARERRPSAATSRSTRATARARPRRRSGLVLRALRPGPARRRAAVHEGRPHLGRDRRRCSSWASPVQQCGPRPLGARRARSRPRTGPRRPPASPAAGRSSRASDYDLVVLDELVDGRLLRAGPADAACSR